MISVDSVQCQLSSYITTGDEDGMAAIIGRVEPFQSGVDDWEQYAERLEQYFAANAITDGEKKRAVFLTVIGKETYSLLSNLLAPDKPATKPYEELVTTVKNHVMPKPLVVAERFRFHQRRQGENESVSAVHGRAATAC